MKSLRLTRSIAPPVLLALAVALVPAASADAKHKKKKRPPDDTAYTITRASGYERVTFAGSEPAGCARRGLCGVSGTVDYTLPGKPRIGLLLLDRTHGIVDDGFALFEPRAATHATVTTEGAAGPCTDALGHRTDAFSLERHGSKLRFFMHDGDPDGVDYIATHCAGPREEDLARSNALPQGSFPAKPLKGPRVSFTIAGHKPFQNGGFAGTSEWRLRFDLKRCGDRCVSRTLDKFFGLEIALRPTPARLAAASRPMR